MVPVHSSVIRAVRQLGSRRCRRSIDDHGRFDAEQFERELDAWWSLRIGAGRATTKALARLRSGVDGKDVLERAAGPANDYRELVDALEDEAIEKGRGCILMRPSRGC
jgi:hypothetical protein